MKLKKFSAAVAAMVAVAFGATACGSDGGGDAEPVKIKAYYTSPLTQYALAQVALDNDLFPDDIKVEVDGGDSTVGVTLASSGRVQMYFNTAPMTENIAHGGAPLAWAATWQEGLNGLFIGRNGVKSLEDMKGKTLGIVQPGLTLTVIANDALLKAGLELDDYTSLSLGTVPALAGAFASGTVDAVVLDRISATRLLNEVDGAVELFDFYNGTPYVGSGVSVNTKWLNDKPEHADALSSFLVGLQAALELMRNDPEKAYPSITKVTGQNDPAVLEAMLTDFVDHSMSTIAAVSDEQILNSLAMLRNEGNDWATDKFAEQVVLDGSYVDNALSR